MAKVCSGSVIIWFCFIILFNFINCSHNEDSVIEFRIKRQTASDLTTKYITLPTPTHDDPIKDDSSNNIDASLSENRDEIVRNHITKVVEDYHLYYNSSTVYDPELAKKTWENFKNMTANDLLSGSHRRAKTVQLSFDFPFYGYPVRNVTVATGGFIYTGENVHSWLAATQYIAPLMANFDTSLSNDSYVKYSDNGTAFTVVWENVSLQDKKDVGKFSFSATLHKNGDIVFMYFSVPISIETIQDDKHPVKVGLSDAYIIDKVIFFARRKTINEYHRVNFASQAIRDSTIIYLYAQPTCLTLTDCVSCLTHNINFNCTWCPTLNKCSTGTDRKRQKWLHKGCDRTQITDSSVCPVHNEKENEIRVKLQASNDLTTEYKSVPAPTLSNVNPALANTTPQQNSPPPSPSDSSEHSKSDGRTVDTQFSETSEEMVKNNITKVVEDYHLYYNSLTVYDPELAKKTWENFKNMTADDLLSGSQRRAKTVQLSFDFPFYGHPVRNVTVATGGFIYTGEYVHSWMEATQYIAPLMANFDTSLSNDSYVKYLDNGTAFTVVWENVSLQDKKDVGKFSFSATLHKNGDIVFMYFSVPISIETIQDDKHPVKVGLSDAYIIDKVIFFARRKTINEYHRVNFASQAIRDSTIIYLYAQPTCLTLTDCVSCLTHNINFNCTWCPTLNKCSTGTDRKRQKWLYKGCDETKITDSSMCPVHNEKENEIRVKRQASSDLTTEYKSVPAPTLSNVNPALTNATPQQNSSVILSPPPSPSDSSEHSKSDGKSVKQESQGGVNSNGAASSTTDASVNIRATIPILTKDRPLLGVNGTGQRKDYSADELSSKQSNIVPSLTGTATTMVSSSPKPAVVSEPINPQSKTSKGPKKVMIDQQKPPVLIPNDDLFDSIDTPFSETSEEMVKNNITKVVEDYHLYYNSSTVYDPKFAKKTWENFKNMSANSMLSKSHRRAMTLQLSFDFPFYGHPVRNVTVATGGFLYTGEYVHSWLAATQYIAPLMANFDTSLSNDSYVKYLDNGTAFTVVWENVSLQDKKDVGKFSFSATLHKNGDIVFMYFSVPISIETIQDDKHPVKVGLSDAYIIDKVIFFARRKTIYEYHRVNFASQAIRDSTIIYLYAQPTCLTLTDCVSCLTHNINFNCTWCPTLNKCSTGTDRKRQDWLHKGCDRTQITDSSMCPAHNERGSEDTSNAWSSLEHNDSSIEHLSIQDKSVIKTYDKASLDASSAASSKQERHHERGHVGVALGLMLPICLIMSALVWVLYAYRNPHTKSGQLLIQYRPSQWTWRRGEARYTAATIHM